MTLSRCELDLDALDPIQRTLAIPLVGRARAHRMFPQLGFFDPLAAHLLERLRFRGVRELEQDRKIVWGSILRTQTFDSITSDFFARMPEATAISLGVGLCTRAARFPHARWIEVDVPEVIEARNTLVPATGRITRIATDLSESRGLDSVLDAALDRASPVLVLAEGFSMFLDKRAHLGAMASLEARLPARSVVAFDYIHPIVCWASRLHRSLRTTGARYRSGLVPSRILPALPRFEARSTRLFAERLSRPLRLLHSALALLGGGSPLYEIACLEVRSSDEGSPHVCTV